MNLELCVMCSTIASGRCTSCLRPICDSICRDACQKLDRGGKEPLKKHTPRFFRKAA